MRQTRVMLDSTSRRLSLQHLASLLAGALLGAIGSRGYMMAFALGEDWAVALCRAGAERSLSVALLLSAVSLLLLRWAGAHGWRWLCCGLFGAKGFLLGYVLCPCTLRASILVVGLCVLAGYSLLLFPGQFCLALPDCPNWLLLLLASLAASMFCQWQIAPRAASWLLHLGA